MSTRKLKKEIQKLHDLIGDLLGETENVNIQDKLVLAQGYLAEALSEK